MLAAAVVEGLAEPGEQPRPDLVIHDLTQDDEETAVSVAPTTEGEDAPVGVEVRHGRRMGGATDRGGPPLLEDDSRSLAPGPAQPGAFVVAMTRHVMSSIGNTPYPTIIELGSEHGGSDYDTAEIQCGRCEAPIDYCHCDALPL